MNEKKMKINRFAKPRVGAVIFLLLAALLCSCKMTEGQGDMKYIQISQKEAKEIMESGERCIILDVRTPEEYGEGHIRGAILIPDYEIKSRAKEEIPDRDALILVYCRSGRRSKSAAERLAEMGYTNVKEFGGIIDWQYSDMIEK